MAAFQLGNASLPCAPDVGRIRCVFEEGALHQFADFQFHHLACRLVNEVAFRDGDHAMTQTEQAQDFEVFARLRHHGIIGGDDQHSEINARGPGKHVLDETLMAGHIDDAEAERRQVEDGKADVDGDAARFLFGQAVAVDAGQRLDERRLTVVDVSGGAEDQVAGHDRSSLHEIEFFPLYYAGALH